MPHSNPSEIESRSAPFDQFKSIQPLATGRRGRDSVEHARHLLYIGRDKRGAAGALIKLTAKPGLVYQHNLANEIASLTTINRDLPDSPYFPVVREHGHLADGRVYLIMTLFDEFPLARAIGTERMPARTVAHLRTALEIARAVAELHSLQIFHVDLNPMNILHRVDKGQPVIRIVDFESSYEQARHSTGVSYNPPTTTGYCAPEVFRRPPDARSDLFSLGAVLYTTLAGYQWTWEGDIGTCLEADQDIDPELKAILRTAVHADPDKRYPSIEEFRTLLAGYLERIWPGRTW